MNRRYFVISALTVSVQYYDYQLFGFLAAKVAPYFFPDDQNIIQLLNTYLVLALAMAVKPIGSIVLGKIGDRDGRPASFRLSLIGTAISSIILFASPSFSQVGYLAIFLLLIARMLVCACVTSGSDGVRIYIYENIEKHRQCYGIGLTALFTQSGTLIAALAALVTTLEIMPEYLWKYAFLFGACMSFLVLYMMAKIDMKEGSRDQFIQEKKDRKIDELHNTSFKRIISNNFSLFITCIFLAGAMGSTNQFILIFFGTYNFEILETIHKSEMKMYIVAAIFIYMIFSVISGIIADKYGKFQTVFLGAICCIVLTILQMKVISRGEVSCLLYLLLAANMPFITMPGAAIYKKAIPIAIRYRLFSLSHAIGSIFISAPTAYISTLIYHKTLLSWAPFCYFITTLLVISLTLLLLKNHIKNMDFE